jgi:hypothetical protein
MFSVLLIFYKIKWKIIYDFDRLYNRRSVLQSDRTGCCSVETADSVSEQ